jgi:hypothetical protein
VPLSSVLHDPLSDYRKAWNSLWRSIRLAEAVAQQDVGECKRAWSDAWVDADPKDVGLSDRWLSALAGPRPPGTHWKPGRYGDRVDWIQLARLKLANDIGRELRFSHPTFEVESSGRLSQSWAVRSLHEVMFWQLFEQVSERPGFGIGTCGYCAGPVLRKRRPGARADQWHQGCRSTGRQRRRRQRQRQEARSVQA